MTATPASVTPPVAASAESVAGLKQKAARGFALISIRYAAVLLLNTGGVLLLSRHVGPEIWGIFALAQFAYLTGQEILGRGMTAYLIQKTEPLEPAEIAAAWVLQHLSSIALALATAAAAVPLALAYGRQEVLWVLIATAVAVYSFGWRAVPISLMERRLSYRAVAFIEIADALLFNAAALALVFSGRLLAGLIAALLLRSLGPSLLALLVARRLPVLWCRDRVSMQRVAGFGFGFGGSTLLGMAIMAVPALLVGPLAGVDALGHVQMATSLYAALLFLSAAAMRVSFSSYSRAAADPIALTSMIERHLRWLAALQVPIVTVFAGASPWWVPALLGPQWTRLSDVLVGMAPGYMLTAVIWPVLSSGLFAVGRNRLVVWWLLGLLGLYASLTFLVVMDWDWRGVALAFSFSYVVMSPMLPRLWRFAAGPLATGACYGLIAVGSLTTAVAWFLFRESQPLPAVGSLVLFVVVWVLHHLPHLRSLRELLLRGEGSAA